MENDKFFKVVMTHAQVLDPDIMGAIGTGEMWLETHICRALYYHTIRGAKKAVEGLLTDHWFKDAHIAESTGHLWRCSKLRTQELHAPGGKAYTVASILYREIRIEAYTIRA